ncbi:MAG: T9SS type A sorting domain-containing protein [Chitinophagales bacterium]|nr:T9SS type A sorting domain-containing protein [Chitinophagales bacterium]
MLSRILFILLCSLPLLLQAQEKVTIKNGNLATSLSYNGISPGEDGTPWISYDQDGQFLSLAYASNLWFGGIDANGNLFTNALTYDYSNPYSSSLGKVFQVNKEQIIAHIADYEDNGVIDNPIEQIFAWPGRDNPHFGEYNDNLELPTDNNILAPFWDVDQDGVYNPSAGDHPVLHVRGCDLSSIIPSQMNWCVYSIAHNITNVPLFEVQLNLFTISCEEENPLNNTLFTHYTIVNQNTELYNEVYWGLFTDLDIGCHTDDYVGSFPERHAAFVYNASNNDQNCDNVSGFGENPPAFGIDILRGPLGPQAEELPISSIINYHNSAIGPFPPATTDPGTSIEYYNYLKGLWRDGSPLTNEGLGYNEGEATNFIFPGLPEQEGNWTEWETQNPAGDRRLLMNFGPFDLQQGAVNEFILSYNYHRDSDNHLKQVEGLRDHIDQVQGFFDNCLDIENVSGLPTCTQIVVTDTDNQLLPKETITLFPNPAHETVTIETEANISSVRLIDATGQQLYNGSGNSIDIRALPSGLYFVGMEINGQKVFKKLVKE